MAENFIPMSVSRTEATRLLVYGLPKAYRGRYAGDYLREQDSHIALPTSDGGIELFPSRFPVTVRTVARRMFETCTRRPLATDNRDTHVLLDTMMLAAGVGVVPYMSLDSPMVGTGAARSLDPMQVIFRFENYLSDAAQARVREVAQAYYATAMLTDHPYKAVFANYQPTSMRSALQHYSGSHYVNLPEVLGRAMIRDLTAKGAPFFPRHKKYLEDPKATFKLRIVD